MSNQKIDLLMMKLMSDYVNGIEPYNFLELKAKVDFASLLRENAPEIIENCSESCQFQSGNDASQSDRTSVTEDSHEDYHEDTLKYSLDDNSDDNSDDNQDDNSDDNQESPLSETSTIPKMRKPRNVWGKKLLEDIKSEFETYFKTEKAITRQQTHSRFLKLFGSRLNAEDKFCPKNSSVANWQGKLDDNLKGWFVETKHCNYVNGIYIYNDSTSVVKSSGQKTLEI